MTNCDVKLRMGKEQGDFSLTINGEEIPSVRLVNLTKEVNHLPVLTIEVYPTRIEIDAQGVETKKLTLCPSCRTKTHEE